MGVEVGRIVPIVYVITGLLCAVSGVLFAIHYTTIDAYVGDTVATVAIAGMVLGGLGNVWGAIIGGFVVVIAVVVLLTMLVMLVRTIEQRVITIKGTLEAAAANTDDTALIAETAARVDAVLAEGLEHHLFLGRVLDKVRS